MKKLIQMNLKTLVLILGCAFALASCSNEDNPIELKLDKTEASVYVDNTVTVSIVSGNGKYTVKTGSESTATATVSETTSSASITITGVAKGNTTVTVTDNSGKTAIITVTVSNAIVGTDTTRFVWNGSTSLLGGTDNWGIAILSNGTTARVAITNLVATTALPTPKQYVLSWTGGYTVGDKTGATLRMIVKGSTPQDVALTSLEVQKAENNLYSIVFYKDKTKGELVFTK